jgi:hypothetical protein
MDMLLGALAFAAFVLAQVAAVVVLHARNHPVERKDPLADRTPSTRGPLPLRRRSLHMDS